MRQFLFTAPIARADGVTNGDDPRMWGSFYCLNAKTLEEARRIMEADPFMQGVWQRVDYYEWAEPRGKWLNPGDRPAGPGSFPRCYIAVAPSSFPASDPLMAGTLRMLASTQDDPEPLSEIAIVRAPSLEDARSQSVGALWVAAVPIAIGQWVRVTSPSDLPTAR
jgi:hypothetical protein